jgi:hypothetical protein
VRDRRNDRKSQQERQDDEVEDHTYGVAAQISPNVVPSGATLVMMNSRRPTLPPDIPPAVAAGAACHRVPPRATHA